MKDHEVSNMLAVLADAEARSTAMLVETMVAAALFKLNPPEGSAVVEVEITQGDILDAASGYFWKADYDEHGTLKLRLARDVESLAAEVTSES